MSKWNYEQVVGQWFSLRPRNTFGVSICISENELTDKLLTIRCWIHSWWEYISSPPKSCVTCDRSTCANKSSNVEQTIKRNLNSSLKNFELTSEMAFWKKPAGRMTYTTWIMPGKYDCKRNIFQEISKFLYFQRNIHLQICAAELPSRRSIDLFGDR